MILQTTTCTSERMIGHDGVCPDCGEVVFPHIYERVQRKRFKPAKRNGLLPVGVRRAK